MVRLAAGEEPLHKIDRNDWVEMFDQVGYEPSKAVALRMSATLSCGRTLPPVRTKYSSNTTDAFQDWELTAEWRWKNRKKNKASETNFTRRAWEAETLLTGAMYNGNPDNTFSSKYCDQHPIAAAWWWAQVVNGKPRCELCYRAVQARQAHFVEKVVKPNAEKEDFPAYALAAPELMRPVQKGGGGGAMSSSASSGALLQTGKSVATEKGKNLSFRLEGNTGAGEASPKKEIDISRHPLLRPQSPIKLNATSRQRNAADKRSMERRHWHIRDKYPYNTSRIGTDSNPNAFTYQVLHTAQDKKDLGRKMQRPDVAWH